MRPPGRTITHLSTCCNDPNKLHIGFDVPIPDGSYFVVCLIEEFATFVQQRERKAFELSRRFRPSKENWDYEEFEDYEKSEEYDTTA